MSHVSLPSPLPPEPQLPHVTTPVPAFVVGTVVTPITYRKTDGTVGTGTRTVVTAADGARTVTYRDSATAIMPPGSFTVEDTPVPESASAGFNTLPDGLTDTQLRATPVPVTGGLTDTQLRAAAVPVSGPLTDTQLRVAPVPISGTVTTGGLTDTQLRAAAVSVTTTNLGLTDAELRATAVPVSGPLTDAQMRAAAVPVSGPATDAQLRATPLPVSGPLTDTQLRATAVPVSGPLTDTQLRATAVPVSGPLTDAQLRATAVPVTLPTGVRTPSVTTSTAAGTVAAGAYSFSIFNRGTTNGTADGDVLVPNMGVNFDAPAGATLAAMAFDATGTTFTILEVR